MESGVWVLNREYIKATDGSILIDIEGYYRWVKGNSGAV
jgi:hypothetical protein